MRTALQPIQRFAKLKAHERRDICIAWASLPIVWSLLKFFRLDKVQAWLLPAAKSIEPGASAQWTTVPRCVRIASRFSFSPTTCLSRSIVICRMLRRRGVNGDLRIGVRIFEGAFMAHAWVEVAGEPLDDDVSLRQSYLPFESFASAQETKFR